MTITIYHNPRCSKSRQTLELLRKHGHEPEIVLYLETPPGAKALEKVIAQLGISPAELIRFKEDKAKELGIHLGDKRSAAAWIKMMVANPELIERPVVINGKKARIGRPPEKVLEIL